MIDRKYIYGAGALLFIGAAWFGFRDGANSTHTMSADGDRFPASDATPLPDLAEENGAEIPSSLPTPTTEAMAPINTVQPVTIYANDGTPFKVVNPPGHEDQTCAAVGGPFQNVEGHRHNAGRLAQALGNGKITFIVNGAPITIDTDADPFPEEVSLVHANDFACK